jgi:hypothetical protein
VQATRHGALGITICSTAFAGLARAQLAALDSRECPLLVIEHPFGSRTRAEVSAIAEALLPQIAAAVAAQGARGTAAGSDGQQGDAGDAADAARAVADVRAAGSTVAASVRGQGAVPALVRAPVEAQAFFQFCQTRRWSDGLPMIAPTRERVERMLGGCARARDEVIATLAPGFGRATVERIAANAVLAGCVPQHLPVLIAAVEAVADPAFNLQAVQATTNPVSTWLIVSGPLARALGVNGGLNCLGQGSAANATLGRALRLILQNIGGAWPGEMDRATHGQPGKLMFCCGENDEQSPWPSLALERGFSAPDSTVTVVGASGTLSMNTHSKDADELLAVIARCMAFPASNDYHYGGEPWLILSPEHAAVLARAGYDKAAVRQRLWAGSTMRAGEFARRDFERTATARRTEFPDYGEDTVVPLSARAQDIGLIVAGGPGTHSVYVPTFGETRAVTRRIDT